MATKDGFPLFLSEHAEESEQPYIGKARDRGVVLSRIFKTGILGVTAAAIVFAILSVGNPLVLFANATAFLVATSTPQDGTDTSTPIVQSTAGAEVLPPTASEAPTGGETSTAADQTQAEINQPPAEALLSQFQVWAAREDERAEAQPVQAQPQPVQAQSPVVQDTRPQIRRSAQKHRQARHVQNARAEVRAWQNLRAKVLRKQDARVQVPAVQDARAQEQPVPPAPSFLQSIGLHN